jgi:hypothetical protein
MTETSTVIGGIFGQPDQIEIPDRSMKRIQKAIFDAEGRHSLIDRLIDFQAIRSAVGSNISQVSVTTKRMDGRPISERILILYRDRRFWRAFAEYGDGTIKEHTLSGAISRIDNPIDL